VEALTPRYDNIIGLHACVYAFKPPPCGCGCVVMWEPTHCLEQERFCPRSHTKKRTVPHQASASAGPHPAGSPFCPRNRRSQASLVGSATRIGGKVACVRVRVKVRDRLSGSVGRRPVCWRARQQQCKWKVDATNHYGY
jgi:hypothetical protein